VDVLNGGQVNGLARRVSAALARSGYVAGTVGNTTPRAGTSVQYGAGAADAARKIGALFGVVAVASAAVRAGNVEVLLGASATFPASLQSSVGASSSPSTSPTSAPPSSGPQGGPVSAGNGIPCVN
jgi:hypothetical protein